MQYSATIHIYIYISICYTIGTEYTHQKNFLCFAVLLAVEIALLGKIPTFLVELVIICK